MELKLRPTEDFKKTGMDADAAFVYMIRYDPELTDVFQSDWVDIVDHIKWFRKNYNQFQIIEQRGGLGKQQSVGYVRTQPNGYIGIGISKEHRGKGIGSKILEQINGRAIIMKDNKASLTAFKKSGWIEKGVYLEKGGKDEHKNK